MKDGEKALLALAAVGGYLYWSKTETKFDCSKERRPAWISRNHHHDPSSPYTMGADGEMINMASVGKPKKGEIFNALNPVASSVPRERPLKKLTTQKEMMQLVFSWPEEKQAEFRSLKTDAEATAYLAKEGYTK